jgi:hypothetical protein
MLGMLVLILLQIALGYFVTPLFAGRIPAPGTFYLFMYGVIAAIVVFLIGLLGAQVLKDVGMPPQAALSSALVFALIGAAIATWGPDLLPMVPWGKVPGRCIVLGAAVLGYTVKK